jgi:hypothetical protein
MAKVPAGPAELYVPGAACAPFADLAWPVDGSSNRFSIDVQPGYDTWVWLSCKLQ